MKRWHVVHTKPRLETQALANLERQGYTCFLPTIAVQKISRKQFRVEKEPLFPRYLFIQLEHAHADAGLHQQNWAPIRSTLGVQGMVKFGPTPASIEDEIISALQQQNLICPAASTLFSENTPVSITDGAFAGVEGLFQRLAQMPSGESRAFVLIELLSKTISLSIAPQHLKHTI